jgi:arginine-tRNA-protein transferase
MYHRLDGKLVAMGVLDLLQNYVNSAYFIYDPDYKFLNLGVMGALRELEYMRLVRSFDKNKYEWY